MREIAQTFPSDGGKTRPPQKTFFPHVQKWDSIAAADREHPGPGIGCFAAATGGN